MSSVPGFFDIVWKLLFWVPVAWSFAVLVVAAVRGRLALERDIIGAIVLSVAGAAAVAAIVTSDGPGFADLLFDVGGPPVFPPALVAVATAVISTASPHVGRPFRSFGHWLIGVQLVGAILLGAAVPSGALAAVALGLLAASLVHLAVGSPGGRPTVSRIRLALADLGLRVYDLAPAPMQPPAGRAEAHAAVRPVEVLDLAAGVQPGPGVRRPPSRRIVVPPIPLRSGSWEWADELLDLVERHLDGRVVDGAAVAEQSVVLGHRWHAVYRTCPTLPTGHSLLKRIGE